MVRRLTSILTFLGLLLIVLLPASLAGTPDNSVVVVLDASGSMGTLNEDKTADKIDDAKVAAVSALDTLNGTTEVALIVFYNCRNIVLEHPFTTDHGSVEHRIGEIVPLGSTALADSLDMAVKLMRNNASGGEGVIILLTDGGENCKGDPVSAARNVKAVKLNTSLHVIDYGSSSQMELEMIAYEGGGYYVSPQDEKELSEYMSKMTDPEQWPDLAVELKRPDPNIAETERSEKDVSAAAAICTAVLLIVLASVLVYAVRNKARSWWVRRRKQRRKAKAARAAERERKAAERRMAEEFRRAEREKMAAERRRRRKEERKKKKKSVCPVHPFFRRLKERREDKKELERRVAEAMRRAEEERRAAELKRKEREKAKEKAKKRRRAEERKRAERERRVKRKRRELIREVGELARNEFGILPPTELEDKIMSDPFGAEDDVAAYAREIEDERRKKEVELREEMAERREERGEAGDMEEVAGEKDGEDRGPRCPTCGGEIRHVSSFDRWFCDECRNYLPKGFRAEE